jgi:hypothetical protein
MTIVLASISRASSILVSHCSLRGNHQLIAQKLLSALENKIPSFDAKKKKRRTRGSKKQYQEEEYQVACLPSIERRTIHYDDQHLVHLLIETENNISIIYLCMTSGSALAVSPRVCFNFLESVSDMFLAKFGKAKTRVANPYAMNKSFRVDLEVRRMEGRADHKRWAPLSTPHNPLHYLLPHNVALHAVNDA